MNKTVKAKDGTVVALCTYSWTDTDGHLETCRGAAKCPVCKQCSRIVDGKELGHCTGHLGLNEHIMATVPGRGTV